MSAAFTPGPWAVSYSTDGMTVDSAKPVRFNLTTAGTAVIARVNTHADAEHFSGEANARLIAAAPLLLDALEQVTDALAQRLGTNAAEWADVSRARAAIAAARGQA
jgi:hypothetical protein